MGNSEKHTLPYIDKPEILAAELRRLYEARISKKKFKRSKRKSLGVDVRIEILRKTNGCCHICGQKLDEFNFQADHVSPHSMGGSSETENYIASCEFCNNYRWNYLPDEFKWIMKIGVWAKTQIEFETEIGNSISKEFIEYEKTREQRRKVAREPISIDIDRYPVREKIDYSKIQMAHRKKTE